MNCYTRALTMVATAGMIPVVLAAPAHAADVTIRQADLIPSLSDTRAQGSATFLEDGLLVTTGENTAAPGAPADNKAAEYWATQGGIPASGRYDWRGTATQPGVQVVFDTNADRADAGSFNVLVGEQVYSANDKGEDLTDWWYTGGSARAVSRGITCPQTSGGSGSDCHGSLAEWQVALPDAEAYAGGFSLGSGVQGEGLLLSVALGDDVYSFTSEDEPVVAPAPVPEAVTGSVSAQREAGRIALTMSSRSARSESAVVSTKLRWRVAVDGRTAATYVQGFAEQDRFVRTFARGSGAHVVKVFKNGEQVRQLRVAPTR